jgi:hypothetical protein
MSASDRKGKNWQNTPSIYCQCDEHVEHPVTWWQQKQKQQCEQVPVC